MSIFLTLEESKILFRGNNFFLTYDSYPVTPGHILIISQELKKDFFELNQVEKQELPLMIEKAKEIIEKVHQPEGFNIGMNCGEVAGQTIMHFHCHVIPRYSGDMENPRGGVRHSVAGKGYY